MHFFEFLFIKKYLENLYGNFQIAELFHVQIYEGASSIGLAIERAQSFANSLHRSQVINSN